MSLNKTFASFLQQDHPALLDDLDLVEEADQFTHLMTLDEAKDPEDLLSKSSVTCIKSCKLSYRRMIIQQILTIDREDLKQV